MQRLSQLVSLARIIQAGETSLENALESPEIVPRTLAMLELLLLLWNLVQ